MMASIKHKRALILLVILVDFVFLRSRSATFITRGWCRSLIGTFAMMYLCGYSLYWRIDREQLLALYTTPVVYLVLDGLRIGWLAYRIPRWPGKPFPR